MSLIAEATIGSPLFQQAISAAPDVELLVEDIRLTTDEQTQFICWARGDGIDAFEAGLDTDPTVGSYRRLADSDGSRLYLLALSETGQESSTYPVAVEHEIVLIDLRFTKTGLHALGRVLDRESLVAYRQACAEDGIEFHLERLYSEQDPQNDPGLDERFGVTPRQQEALRTSLEMGYFDVPRAASLEEVAAELDITPQALSTRLRRGHTNLLTNTIS